MKVSVKRAYDDVSTSDGTRVLVDRLWPRGITKKRAHIDVWAKEIAPTGALRTWFHKDPDNRYKEFAARFRAELSKNRPVVKQLVKGNKHITLITAAKDVMHSHVPTLVTYIKKL